MKILRVFVIVLVTVAFVLSCTSKGSTETVVNEGFKWSLEDAEAGAGGWTTAPDEFWDFKGTMNVSRDATTMGKPMLRVDVDFSRDAGSWWSEPKLRYDFEEPISLAGLSRLAFDFYYNPNNASTGFFKGKFIGFLGTRSIVEAELDGIRAIEEVGDYMKANVVFRIRSTREIDSLRIGIVGAVTNYNGPIFIDNIRLE